MLIKVNAEREKLPEVQTYTSFKMYLLVRLDLRLRSRTIRGQFGPWPLGLNENEMACFYNDTPLLFIGKGDFHLLQHILTTKVDVEHIPNIRLGSQGK